MKVGDKVVCVDDIKPVYWHTMSEFYPEFIMENKVYTIRKIYKSNTHKGYAFNLEEIVCNINPLLGYETGFADWRFRKFQPPKDELAEIQESLEIEVSV